MAKDTNITFTYAGNASDDYVITLNVSSQNIPLSEKNNPVVLLLGNVINNPVSITATVSSDSYSGTIEATYSVNVIDPPPPKLPGTITYTPEKTDITVGDSVTFSYTGDNSSYAGNTTVSLTFRSGTDMNNISGGDRLGAWIITGTNGSVKLSFTKAGTYTITDAHAELQGYGNSDPVTFTFNVQLPELTGTFSWEPDTIRKGRPVTLKHSDQNTSISLKIKKANGDAVTKIVDVNSYDPLADWSDDDIVTSKNSTSLIFNTIGSYIIMYTASKAGYRPQTQTGTITVIE